MTLTQVTGSTGVKKPVDFADNEKARFGAGNDLEIYHDGNNSFIKDTGTGSLKISTSQLQLTNAADDEVMISANQDGEVQLCFNGLGKLNTKSDGIDVIGEVQCDSLDVDGNVNFAGSHHYFSTSSSSNASLTLKKSASGADPIDYLQCRDSSNALKAKIGGSGEVECLSLDVNGTADISGATNFHANVKLQDNDTLVLGAGNDLQIFHDGTDNRIVTDGPNIRIGTSGEEFAKFNNNGAVDLYYDNSRKFSTATDGVSVVGNLGLGDGGVIACGQSSDLRIQHSGSNSFVETSTSSTGDLYVISQGTNHDLYLQANDDIFIRPANGEAGIVVNGNGSVELYYDGQMRFETNASAVTMRGGGEHRCEGHFRPWANNTYDLGTNGDRWRNVYTNDLHLSNEGSANDIDGTWGSFTIQEGEDDLFLINRRSGKKYKFNLTEVN